MDPATVPQTMVTASKSSSFFENIGTLLCLGISLRAFARDEVQRTPETGAKSGRASSGAYGIRPIACASLSLIVTLEFRPV